jgi:glycosyltransferase involved in cell wall biosynthesis
MRLAIVMSHADRSMGGATRDMVLCRALRRQGVEAAMFRMHAGPAVEREAMLKGGEVPVTFAPIDRPEPSPVQLVSAALREEVAAFAPDVVLYKGMNYRVNEDLQAALPSATRYGFIVGGATTDPMLDGAAIVLGEYQEQLQRCFPALLEAGRALVLPKWIDLRLAGPGIPVPREEAAYDIINVGTFAQKRKNQGALVPLAARHRIAMVGAGPLRTALRSALRGRARQHVSFLGRLAHPEVFAALRQARIMVHTSTMDGLPRATVEAMACGLPVVAYRATLDGGIPHGSAGLLVAEAALPHAVEMLLADDEMRIAMGRNARRHVERRHGERAIGACAKQVLDILGS